ncbi:MAG: hypothetical protein ACAI25_17665 [Planctomycetota bacterium]
MSDMTDQPGTGIWARIREAMSGAPEGPANEAAPPPPPPPPPPPRPEPLNVSTPRPRKIRRTVFDGGKKPETRGTRLRRVAHEKRENLALVVGAEVEKVIVEKIGSHDEGIEKLGRVADGFSALNDALVKIPQSTSAQVEVMGGQLTALHQVRGELELQRAQRERVIEGVQRLEKAIQTVTDRIEAQSRAAADETDRIERTMAFFAARVHEQSTSILAAQEATAANELISRNALAQAFYDSQQQTVKTVEKLLDEKERAARDEQTRERLRIAKEKVAREKMREVRGRILAERDQQGRRSRRARMAAVSVLGLVLVGFAAAWFVVDEQRTSVAKEAEERADRALKGLIERGVAASVTTRAAATTLPAGFSK